ncbi:MAG: hypothetical protein CL489_03730 [Acidobacteria bacterium]|nr:hypothetical protein [Acidobacteriota bacterium]
MNWTPLHLHTHYSLLDGLSKPSRVAERCSELGYSSCAVTDHGTVSGAVAFTRAMKERDIKPILGCELYLSQHNATIRDKTNRQLSHLVVLAKNLNGWLNLIKIVSRSNDEDVFYFKPRIDLSILEEMNDGNLIAFSGHPGSDLANVLFTNFKKAYNAPSYDEAAAFLKRKWKEECTKLISRYIRIFGKENFFVEIQLIDKDNFPAAELIAECLRDVSRERKTPTVATADSHYPKKEDAVDQRLLVCSALKTTLKKVEDRIRNGEDVGLSCFFKSNNYHIPSIEEMKCLHTEEEMDNSLVIANMCEEYDILSHPMLPKYKCPEDMDEDDYLKFLCRDGWKRVLVTDNKIDTEDKKQLYLDTLLKEFRIIKEAKLAGYFLVVRDIVQFVKNQDWLPGPGRGSAAGSLVSYLIGITKVDPVEFDLIFERFYNAGRNTQDHISLPDVDIDVPSRKREHIIEYIKSKYGKDCVGQMLTFGRLQGRSALKEVLRAHDACSYDEMNNITKRLPQEHEISDQLQEMDKEDRSVIKWALINMGDELKDYCRIDDEGKIVGDYSKLFDQAIRLEGTYKSQGKHAAGVVISSQTLSHVCPMVRETNGVEKIAGMEMEDLEAMGHVKFDILGVSLLDKIMGIRNQLLRGEIE